MLADGCRKRLIMSRNPSPNAYRRSPHGLTHIGTYASHISAEISQPVGRRRKTTDIRTPLTVVFANITYCLKLRLDEMGCGRSKSCSLTGLTSTIPLDEVLIPFPCLVHSSPQSIFHQSSVSSNCIQQTSQKVIKWIIRLSPKGSEV